MAAAPEPRGFVTATGMVFQAVGLILTLGGCCVWSLSGHWDDRAAGTTTLVTTLQIARLVGSFAGGFGLLAAGIGMQGEHPRSATAGMVAAGGLGGVWWTSTVLAIWPLGQWVTAAASAGVAACATVLFLLAGHSRGVLRDHPPPADRNVVTEEFLEAQRARRH